MARKRGHGEGSIYRRPDGRWIGQITIGFDSRTGKQKRKTVSGKTRQEVAEKITKIARELQTGTYTDSDKITLGEWLDIWVETYSKPTVRPSTYDSYKQLIRTHLRPNLGRIPLQKLQSNHIQKFYNDRLQTKRKPRTMPKDEENRQEVMESMPTLSASTIKHMHVVLRQALEQAVRERRMLINPAKATKPPKVTRPEASYLNAEQVAKFLDVASEDKWYSAFLVTLGTGMRLGELCALRWENVDLKKGVIHVKESVRRVNNDDVTGPKTRLLVQSPKTEKGKRAIPLPGDILTELKKHKKKQAEIKLQLGQAYNDRGYVFCWEDGRIIDPSFLSKHFKRLIVQCGYKNVTFHSLRHSYASALLAAGEHPKVVQELLGHAQISMTLDTYSHVAPEIKERAAAKIDDFLRIKKTSQDSEG